jgi:hypothetical protein
MTLANQDELEDEQKGEEEIKRVREAMSRMAPEERKLYETFVQKFWPQVVKDLKVSPDVNYNELDSQDC